MCYFSWLWAISKMSTPTCAQLSWIFTLMLQQEAKHLSPVVSHHVTEGTVQHIWNGWPMPRSFKEPGILWCSGALSPPAKKHPVFGIRYCTTHARELIHSWKHVRGAPKSKRGVPFCLLAEIIKCIYNSDKLKKKLKQHPPTLSTLSLCHSLQFLPF